jgi:hypothetical protein
LVHQSSDRISRRVFLGLQRHSKVPEIAASVPYFRLIQSSKETKCPWDPESSFYKLVEEVETLQRQLNRHLHLTEKNTDYYLRNGRASRSYYVQLHSVLALCNMALHREYIAYLAWEQLKPAGPVDGPPLPPPPPQLATYWEDNARKCFHAAKQFLDLAWRCYQSGKLVETPLVGFAMFYVTQISRMHRHPHALPIANTNSHLVRVLSPPG